MVTLSCRSFETLIEEIRVSTLGKFYWDLDLGKYWKGNPWSMRICLQSEGIHDLRALGFVYLLGNPFLYLGIREIRRCSK